MLIEDVQLHFKPRTTAMRPESEAEREAARRQAEEEKHSWTKGLVTNVISKVMRNLRVVVRRVVVRYAHTEEARQGSALDTNSIDKKEEFAVGLILQSFTIQSCTKDGKPIGDINAPVMRSGGAAGCCYPLCTAISLLTEGLTMKSTGTKLCLLEGLCVFATFPGAEKDARQKAQLTENLSVRDALSRLMRMPTLEDAARGICPAGSHAVLEPMAVSLRFKFSSTMAIKAECQVENAHLRFDKV